MDECRKSAVVDAMTRIPYGTDKVPNKRKSLTHKVQKSFAHKNMNGTSPKETSRSASKEDCALSVINISLEPLESKKVEYIEKKVN
jgi:hypothetical protein